MLEIDLKIFLFDQFILSDLHSPTGGKLVIERVPCLWDQNVVPRVAYCLKAIKQSHVHSTCDNHVRRVHIFTPSEVFDHRFPSLFHPDGHNIPMIVGLSDVPLHLFIPLIRHPDLCLSISSGISRQHPHPAQILVFLHCIQGITICQEREPYP